MLQTSIPFPTETVRKIFPSIKLSGLRPEEDLLLSCAMTFRDEERKEKIFQLLHQPLDWTYILWQADRHGILPLLYYHLDQTSREWVPPDTLNQLQEYFDYNRQTNLWLTRELLRLLDLFEKESIPVIPYGGLLLAESAYGEMANRQFPSLDIFIHREDVLKAKELLIKEGYHLSREMNTLKVSLYLESHYEYKFTHRLVQLLVRLHWNIAPKYFSLSMDLERLWNSRRFVSFAGKKIATFSSEDLLFFLCVYGSIYRWTSVSFITDISQCLAQGADMDWHEVLREAALKGAERIIFLGLYLSKTLLDAPVPEDVFERIQKEPAVKQLADPISRCLFQSEKHRLPEGLKRRLFYFRLRERWQDKLKYLQRNLISTAPADGNRSYLPSFLSFLYPVINPVIRLFRIVFKYRLGFSEPVNKIAFEPSETDVVERMLQLADVKTTDIVYDLGCGDGRIVIAAAKRYGARGVGIDIDPERIRNAAENARKEGVENLVTFIQQDALTADFSEATVVCLYMTFKWNQEILPKLQAQLHPGVRVVSHVTVIGNWPPIKAEMISAKNESTRMIYLWQV